jgi:hypothetical protein
VTATAPITRSPAVVLDAVGTGVTKSDEGGAEAGAEDGQYAIQASIRINATGIIIKNIFAPSY